MEDCEAPGNFGKVCRLSKTKCLRRVEVASHSTVDDTNVKDALLELRARQIKQGKLSGCVCLDLVTQDIASYLTEK